MSFLEDHTGGKSTSRLLALIAVAVFFGVWAYVSIRTTTLAAPPEMIVLAVIGIVTNKTVQRFAEKDTAVSKETTTTETVTVTPEPKP